MKRKRDEYEDSFMTDAQLCTSLLQTSVLKLQKTPTTTSRGRKRSSSLRRSVLIFNMVHSLQTDFGGSVHSSHWHSFIPKPAIAIDNNTVVDDETAVNESADDGITDNLSSCSSEAEAWCNNLPEIDSCVAWHKDTGMFSDKKVDDSIVRFDCSHHDSELSSIIGEKASLDVAFVPQLPCGSLWTSSADGASLHASQTQTILSDEMVDFEASLFDFDCLDSHPHHNSAAGISKEMPSQQICGHQLELLDDDIEYLMHILVDS
jgi:hypothetical protein